MIFEKRAKDVKDKLAKIAAIEDKMYKRKKEPVDQKVEKKYANDQAKDGGEEKYETKIYSISATSGKLSNSCYASSIECNPKI